MVRNKEREDVATYFARRFHWRIDEHRGDISRNAMEKIVSEEIRNSGFPTTAIILGTGWGDALKLERLLEYPFTELEGFKSLGQLQGHNRKLVYGRLKGKTVWVLDGRVHLNEDPTNLEIPKMVRLQVEMLFHLGVKNLIVTNAAGSLSCDIKVGDLVVADGFLTLNSPAMPLWAGEFCSPEDALSPLLRKLAIESAVGLIDIHQGGYAMVRGPFFEGRKYDKAILRNNGASTVGMSTLPEACIASLYKEEGVKMLAVSFITNTDSEDHSHEENLARVKASAGKLSQFIERIVAKI